MYMYTGKIITTSCVGWSPAICAVYFNIENISKWPLTNCSFWYWVLFNSYFAYNYPANEWNVGLSEGYCAKI